MEVSGVGINALLDEIIIHILSFMPMKAAAQTGTLSSRWRHLWKLNPVLDFTIPCIPYPSPPVDFGFVNRCLGLHRAPTIRRFIVIAEVNSPSKPDVENWVDFAISKHVRSLEFYWWIPPQGLSLSFLKLPNSFYDPRSNGSLEQLVLCCVDFSPPLPPLAAPASEFRFRGFASLKKLTLFHSKLTDVMLGAIMTTCLLLESLALRFCRGLVNVKVSSMALKEFEFYRAYPYEVRTVEVSAPNLVTLKIRLCSNIIRLNNSCPLVEASLFEEACDPEINSNARKLLAQLNRVKLLAACHWILELLVEEYYMSGNRCTIFRNLKEFYFMGSDMNEEYIMVMFLAFLEDCPLLEKLRIDFRMSCWAGIHKKLHTMDMKAPPLKIVNERLEYVEMHSYFVELEGGEKLPHVGFLHGLKYIELLYISGYKYEMELVKRLLEKTPSLETLSLVFEDPEQFSNRACQQELPPYQRELIREQVCLFNRASPNAQILIT